MGPPEDAEECDENGIHSSVLALATAALTSSVAVTVALATAAEWTMGTATKWVSTAVYIIVSGFFVFALGLLLKSTVPGKERRACAINEPSLVVGRVALIFVIIYLLSNLAFIVVGVFPGSTRKLFDQTSIVCTSRPRTGFQSLKYSGNDDINRIVDCTLKSFPEGNDVYVFEQMTPFKENYESFVAHIDVSEHKGDPEKGKQMEVARAYLINRDSKGRATTIRPLHVPEHNSQTTRTVCVDRPDKESIIVVVFCSPGKVYQSLINLRKE